MYSWMYLVSLCAAVLVFVVTFKEQYFNHFLHNPLGALLFCACCVLSLIGLQGHYDGRGALFLYSGFFSCVVVSAALFIFFLPVLYWGGGVVALIVRSLLGYDDKVGSDVGDV